MKHLEIAHPVPRCVFTDCGERRAAHVHAASPVARHLMPRLPHVPQVLVHLGPVDHEAGRVARLDLRLNPRLLPLLSVVRRPYQAAG